MSRWTRSYDLEDESRPRPATGEGPTEVGRVGGDAQAHDRPREVSLERGSAVEVMRPADRQDLPLRDFAHLTASVEAQCLTHGDSAYQLTGAQVRALATIGAFRAIPRDDVIQRGLLSTRDLNSLKRQGLVWLNSVTLRGETRSIVTLTTSARRLLTEHRTSHPDRDSHAQPIHSGLVKPGELPHDSHLYALYEIAAEELTAQGATIHRVTLDYTMKSEYQKYLNRRERDPDSSDDEERRAWAEEHGFTLVDDELHFPDLRIEYSSADGELRTHDVELVTVHYSGRSIAAKRGAGFNLYRRGFAPRPDLFQRLV